MYRPITYSPHSCYCCWTISRWWIDNVRSSINTRQSSIHLVVCCMHMKYDYEYQQSAERTRAVRDRIPPSRRIWSRSRVRIRIHTPDPDSGSGFVIKFNGDVLVQGYKFSWESDHSLWRYKPNCGKMTHHAMLKKLQKILGSGFGGGWLPKFNQFFFCSTCTSAVKCSWRFVQ